MSFRDRQRSSVYDWERIHVAPKDLNIVPFNSIQLIVNWIWEQEGLKYPPIVEEMPKQKHALGDALRTKVRFRETTYTWIILHELSHAMTSTVEDVSNGHGALFMGVYIQLLSRYLKLPFGELANSAEANGLRVKLDAKPVFLE